MFSFEDGDLLSESEDLRSEVSAGPKKDSEGGKQSEDELDHETTVATPFNTGIRNLTIRPQVIDLARRLSSGNTQAGTGPRHCHASSRWLTPSLRTPSRLNLSEDRRLPGPRTRRESSNTIAECRQYVLAIRAKLLLSVKLMSRPMINF
jgi:hypothetical protein